MVSFKKLYGQGKSAYKKGKKSVEKGKKYYDKGQKQYQKGKDIYKQSKDTFQAIKDIDEKHGGKLKKAMSKSSGCGCGAKRSLAKRSKRKSPKKRKRRSKSPTRGWAKQSPGRAQREKMKAKCGKKCFLSPQKMKYPICTKNTCKINCKGVHAAYQRSKQYKKPHLSTKARSILKKKCNYTPSPKRRSKSPKRKSKSPKKKSKKKSPKKRSKK